MTARERLAPGEPLEGQLRAVVRQAQAAAVAGADLLQIREPRLPDAMLLHLAIGCCEAARGSDLRILVNDRPDVALAAGAHGVQLKESSISAADVRRLSADILVGCSVHSSADASEASRGGSDFVLFGTMFPTDSKPRLAQPADLSELAAAVRTAAVPVLAIGGIDGTRVAAVARVAAGVAAIGWFATTDARALADAVAVARSAFDSAAEGPHN